MLIAQLSDTHLLSDPNARLCDHQQFDTARNGVRFVGAPSTFRQLRHGCNPHYTDTLEPPAAQLVELFDDGEVSCETIRAG